MITGLHHVTTFAKSPDSSVAFCTGVLGLRLVKRTVNFDDPGVHHLYFGDRIGRPGSLLTTFPDPRSARGKHGTAEIERTVFVAPAGTMGWWASRLAASSVGASRVEVFGRERLEFEDHDGLRLGIVEGAWPREADAPKGDSPADKALAGIECVSISVPNPEEMAAMLVDLLGFAILEHEQAKTAERWRLGVGGGRPGERLELVRDAASTPASFGAGIVHHVAWRVPDDDAQHAVRDRLLEEGLAVTSVRDRHYFRSIYFRIPPGIVFEVATDSPGFLIDEDEKELGASLRLPPEYEERRAEIERRLPSISAAPSEPPRKRR